MRMRDTIDFVPRCRVNVVCFMYVVRSPYGMTRSCYEVILPLHVVCVPVSFVMGGSISHYYIVSDTIYCECWFSFVLAKRCICVLYFERNFVLSYLEVVRHVASERVPRTGTILHVGTGLAGH